MKKKVNKRMPTPKQKLIYNCIPTSFFVVFFCVNILLVKKLPVVPAVSSTADTSQKETEM